MTSTARERYVTTVDPVRDGWQPGVRSTAFLHDTEAADGPWSSVHFVRTPPGEGSPKGAHSHEFLQLVYLLRGEITVEMDDESFLLAPGELVTFPVGVTHRHWNSGSEDEEHLSIDVFHG